MSKEVRKTGVETETDSSRPGEKQGRGTKTKAEGKVKNAKTSGNPKVTQQGRERSGGG